MCSVAGWCRVVRQGIRTAIARRDGGLWAKRLTRLFLQPSVRTAMPATVRLERFDDCHYRVQYVSATLQRLQAGRTLADTAQSYTLSDIDYLRCPQLLCSRCGELVILLHRQQQSGSLLCVFQLTTCCHCRVASSVCCYCTAGSCRTALLSHVALLRTSSPPPVWLTYNSLQSLAGAAAVAAENRPRRLLKQATESSHERGTEHETADKQQLTDTMKRRGPPSTVAAAKRQKLQQPSSNPTATASAVSTSAAVQGADKLAATSTNQAQQSTLAASTVRAPSLFTVVLDNTGIFGLVASCLCFSGQDNSLLLFARCCRLTHSLVMRDGLWWRVQSVQLEVSQALVPWGKWSPFAYRDRTLAVLVDGFGARQQAILRRLVGDKVYEREVAPKLRETRTVMCRPKTKRGMAVLGPKRRRHAMRPPRVHPQLTAAFFASLAQHVLKPLRPHSTAIPKHGDKCGQLTLGCCPSVHSGLRVAPSILECHSIYMGRFTPSVSFARSAAYLE